MKKILILLAIIATFFLLKSVVVQATTILFPYQGGTGIGTATPGDVGDCLTVSDDAPFTYTLGPCGTGTGTQLSSVAPGYNQGINYYHESMGYITRSTAQIDADLDDMIAHGTQSIRVLQNPMNPSTDWDSSSQFYNIIQRAKLKGLFVLAGANFDQTSTINYANGTATGGSATTLVDSGKTWTVNEWAGFQVYITAGTGNGQAGMITSNTATTLTIAAEDGFVTFSPSPDGTSVYKISFEKIAQGPWQIANGYSDRVILLATQAYNAGADAFDVGNEMYSRRRTADTFTNATNFPGNIRALATAVDSATSFAITNIGYATEFHTVGQWASGGGVGSMGHIGFNFYGADSSFYFDTGDAVSNFGADKVWATEWSTENTFGGEAVSEAEYTRRLRERQGRLRGLGIRPFAFTYRETTDDGFGYKKTIGTGGEREAWNNSYAVRSISDGSDTYIHQATNGQVLGWDATNKRWTPTTTVASGDGVSNWRLNLFGDALIATSSTKGIGIFASSTIGGGTGATGLTINGGATTTGNAYFGGVINSNGAGSASSPRYILNGDDNTGLYQPGSDQMAISTGGIGALFINNNQQIAVGQNNFDKTFNVTGDGFLVRSSDNSKGFRARFGGATDFEFTRDAYFSTWNSDGFSGNQYTQFILKGDGTPTEWKRAITFNVDATSDQDIKIKGDTNDNLFIADVSADAIGIGTTTPSRLLTVQGDGYFLNNITSASSTFGYASTTGISGTNLNFTSATTTNFFATLASSTNFYGAGLSTCNGASQAVIWSAGKFSCNTITASGDGVSNWKLNAAGDALIATSSTKGIGIFASSTIGDGTQTGGLTINGGATTTGNSYFKKTDTGNLITLDNSANLAGNLIYWFDGYGDTGYIDQYGSLNASVAGFRASANGALAALSIGNGTTGNGTNVSLITTNNVGIATSTPSESLLIVGSERIASSTYNYIRPLLIVSTTTDSAGNLMSISATSSLLSNTSSLTGLLADNGTRIAVGNYEYMGMTGLLDQFVLHGRMRNPDWFQADCPLASGAVAITSDTSAATGFELCSGYDFYEDTTATLTSFSGGGYGYSQLGSSAATDGAGVFLRSLTGGFLIPATSTPSMEVTARIGTIAANSSTTNYYIGYSNLAVAGTTYETEPTVGCYFVASTTQANWRAICRTSASVVTNVDTTVSSTTNGIATGGGGKFRTFRIDMDSDNAAFYIANGNTTALTKVADISTTYPGTVTQNAGIWFGRGVGTQAIKFDFFGLNTWWRRFTPNF